MKITLAFLIILTLFSIDVFAQRSAYSPDGKILASPGKNYTVNLRDGNNAELLHTLSGHKNSVNTVAFSPDGKILASGPSVEPGGALIGSTAEIILWNPETGEQLKTLTGHETRVNSVAFHPNGRILASAGVDHQTGWGTVRLWDVETGKQLRMIKAHETSALSVVFTSDGKHIVSSGWTGQVYIWNAETGIIHQFTERKHLRPVYSITISPNGKVLASGDSKRIVLWDTDTWQVIEQFENVINVQSLAFSPDGRILASAHGSKYFEIWDVNFHYKIKTVAVENIRGRIYSLAFNPNGQVLALGGSILWPLYNTRVNITSDIVDLPRVGDTFTVNLDITEGVKVAGYQLSVVFDRGVLNYVSSANGSFLSENSSFATPIYDHRYIDDEVTLSATSIGGEYEGNGTLATITFEVRGFKDTVIKLSDLLLTDKNGNEIPHYIGNIGSRTKLFEASGGASPAIISISPSPVHLKAPGKNIVFDVNITGGENISDFYFRWNHVINPIIYISTERGDYFKNGIGNGDGTLATVAFEAVRIRRDYDLSLDAYIIGKDGLRYIPIHEPMRIGYPKLVGHMPIPIVMPNSEAIITISPKSIPHPGIGGKGSFDINITGGQNIVEYGLLWDVFYRHNRISKEKYINLEWNGVIDGVKLSIRNNDKNSFSKPEIPFRIGIENGDGTLATGTFEMRKEEIASIPVTVFLVDSDGFVYIGKNEQGDLPSISITHIILLGDVNRDGFVNILDLVAITSKFGQTIEKDDPADINEDGVVNVQDLVIVANAISNAETSPDTTNN